MEKEIELFVASVRKNAIECRINEMVRSIDRMKTVQDDDSPNDYILASLNDAQLLLVIRFLQSFKH